MAKRRISWIDTCKAISIFAIVIGHVLRGGALQRYVMSFHVPLFFLLSGVVFSCGKEGFFTFTAKKMKAVLAPYFIWGFISCIIYAFLGQFAANSLGVDVVQNDSFIITLLSFIYGNESVMTMVANLPLWFLPCVFMEYLIMYPVDLYVDDKYLPIAAVVAFIIGGLNANVFKIFGLPFNAENSIFMSGFFIMGMIIGRSDLVYDSEKFSPFQLGGAIALIALGAAVSQMNDKVVYMWSIYGIYPLFMFGALVGCMGWVLLCRQLPPCAPITAVGRSTLSILVMHKFPILFFQVIIPGTKALLTAGNSLCGIVISVIVIEMCMAVKMIFGKKLSFML